MAKKQTPSFDEMAYGQQVKAWVRTLENAAYSRSMREKFSDWLEMCYCAFAKLTAPNKERAEALEARYMKVVGRYTDKELDTAIREAYPLLMAQAIQLARNGGHDFLGHVAGELNALSAEQGQFFTPYEVSRMLAEMQMIGLREQVMREGYVTVSDPAVGAGSMLLAFADALEQHGMNPCIHMLAEAVDVSNTAYQMCYLQLTWRGVPARVVHGNSLSLEVFEEAWTLPTLMFHDYHGHNSFKKPNHPVALPRQRMLIEGIAAD